MDFFLILLLSAAFYVYWKFVRPSDAARNDKRPSAPPRNSRQHANIIRDNFDTLEEVQTALRRAGLESSNLIIGVDYTKSNTWNGEKTFGGKSLHHIDPHGRVLNPYQRVIKVIGKTLQPFDDDGLIPCFGFGDDGSRDRDAFTFSQNPCVGVDEVLRMYNSITPSMALSGPTNFAPVIYRSLDIIRASWGYHILIIIADGQVTNQRATAAAIVEASKYPLSIIIVGVGDGPWDVMEKFDDELPERRFDNVQFVNYNEVIKRAENEEVSFATAALMEVPEQYNEIKRLGLLEPPVLPQNSFSGSTLYPAAPNSEASVHNRRHI
mmetsp:Transcript_44564/g.115889  ORF Transcript_44564/g.115889 Transcript_44564/m.115889 type:complete len:323 (-) Transcript_44564:359-1327(-)